MSNVFLKNTTSSAITVAGYTVYYIDNTNAEIVEVETAGQAIPSVGDMVIFGNYQQTSSTPAPIEWTVLDVDDGCALLISKKILDACQFNLSMSNITWETSAFRTWLNSTFLNAAFDSTEKTYIQRSRVQTPSNPTYGTSGGNDTDDYIFVLSIQEATNYFTNDTDRKALATDIILSSPYRTSNAMSDTSLWHNSDNCAVWILRSMGETSMKAANVSHEGVVWVQGDDVNSNWTGFRPVLWMKCKSKYNAFKYTLSGTSYWYVIDGEHDTWTDDLSAWGYTEVQPVPALPTVNASSGDYYYNSINPGYSFSTYETFDSGKLYSLISEDSNHNKTYYGWQTREDSGYVYAKNVSDNTIYIRYWSLYYTDSANVTLITVYDSSNNAYNAFKYTASGADYYYVLDGTQTDWTDDLASIGYYPNEVEILLGFKWNSDQTELVAVSDLSYDYYWTRVITQKDKDLLALMGIWANTSYKYGSLKSGAYTYTFVAIYSDIGETIASSYDITRFQIRDYVSSVGTIKGLWYDATATSSAMTWKCRITKNS